ncbi:MAG: PKD domain-containing protein [Methanomassiliicoccus sp.]|nr:PKD domain-containing protein [Methanomassiliicoccus sp.]
MKKRCSRLMAFLSVMALMLPGVLIISDLPSASAAPTYGVVSVQGTTILVDGQAPADKFFGVVDTTALAFATLAYIEGQTQYAGKSSVFNGPDTGSYSAVSPSDTAAHFFDRYFALLAYYHCNTVRIGAGDTWATKIQYDAWANHHDAFISLLRTMEAAAEAHNIWIVLVLAGSTEYPACTFGGSGTVFDNSSSAYSNYINYSTEVMASLDGLKGIAWFDMFNEPDHNAVYASFWKTSGGKSAFHAWACSVANDTRYASSHPRTMGVAGLGNMFGWGRSDFDVCTGTVPFEIASRHYYASATGSSNAYLFSTPEAWARADGKPLYWGEIANNGVYPLVRYAFGESSIWSAGGQAITSMVLTGTAGYPLGASTAPNASFSVTPTSGNATTVFTVDASACTDKQDASSELQVRWDWNDDGSYDTAWNLSKTASTSYARSGVYTIRMQVMNSIGAINSTSTTVTVRAGDPSLIINTPSDGARFNTTSVPVYWNSTDPGADIAVCSIQLDGGAPVSMAPAATSYTLTGLTDGQHTVAVSCQDGDGIYANDSVLFLVDTTSPGLIITAPAANANVGGDVALAWKGSDVTSGIASYYVRLDGGAWTTLSPTTVSYAFTGLSSGSHTASVRAVDALGNLAEASVTFTVVRSSPPTVTIAAPTSGGAYASTSMTVKWTGSSSTSSIASYLVRMDGSSWTTLSSSTSSYTYRSLAQGAHTVTVRAVDLAGSYSEATATFVVDTAAPSLTVTTPTSGSYVSAQPKVGWKGSDVTSGIASYLVRVDGGTWTTLSSSTSSYTTGSLSQGSHSVTVRAVDKAGNYKDATVSFRVDAAAPSLTITSPRSGSTSTTTSVAVKWSGSDSYSGLSAYYVKLDNGVWTQLSSTTTSYTFRGLSHATHTVTVRAVDKVGNVRDVAVSFTVK